jgi:Rrf2 family protein
MKFSAQEEYGLRLLVQIGRRSPKQTTIPELARLESLSEPHVAKLLMILRRAGFIDSQRGQLGGYSLAEEPSKLVLASVLEALGGRIYDDEFCRRHSGLSPTCVHLGKCLVHELWQDVQTAIDSVLKHRTLQDILDLEATIVRKDEVAAIPNRGSFEVKGG